MIGVLMNRNILGLKTAIISGLLMAFFSNLAHAESNAEKVFTFGIVPQQSAVVLAKKWLPILKYLSQKTGYKFVFKTTSSIPEFEKNVLNKEYDFAYMNPYHYTVFHDKSGYEALLKQGDKQIRGILVTHIDSDINELEDLQNLKIAFPAPAAFAATVIPQSILKAKSIIHESSYVSSHESVYKNVAYGNFSVGGGIERTFANTPDDIRNKLKVFWRSKGYTPHAIAAAPQVSEHEKSKVKSAFLGMNHDTQGRKLLESLKFKRIMEAIDSDWDDVRQLDINLLADLKKVSG